MKFFKSAVLLTLFSFLFTQVNATPFTLDPQEQLEKELSNLVDNSADWGNFDSDVTLKISLMINADGEIVVLSTNNEDFDGVAKAILNYKKVQVDAQYRNKVLILPVRLTNA